jgi:hypothetical protein
LAVGRADVPLFSRKPKYSLDEFCAAFYLEVIPDTLPHNVPGFRPDDVSDSFPLPDMSDINTKMADLTVNQVAAIDPRFGNVDRQRFEVEFAALRLECFAAAWCHSFKDDKRVLGQALLLREYLKRNARDDIWEAMRDYNHGIARSTQRTLPTNERLRAAAAMGQNQFRWSMMEKWTTLGIDDEVAGHAINLNFTEESWAKGHAQNFLTYSLLRRIGMLTEEGDPLVTETASAALMGTIAGMYRDPKERIARVDIEAPGGPK